MVNYTRRPHIVRFLEIQATTTPQDLADWFQRPHTAYRILFTETGEPARINAWDNQAGFPQFDLVVTPGVWVYVEMDRLGQVVAVELDPHNLGPDPARFVEDTSV